METTLKFTGVGCILAVLALVILGTILVAVITDCGKWVLALLTVMYIVWCTVALYSFVTYDPLVTVSHTVETRKEAGGNETERRLDLDERAYPHG